MTLETKRDLLRVLILEDGYYLDSIVYRLLINDSLTNVISKINDKSLLYNVNLDNKFNAKDFIKLLNRFVVIFRDTFTNMLSVEYIIEIIFSSNIELIEDYFLNYSSSDSILNEKIYKIIIANFVANSKYIKCIETLLNEKKIEIKKVDNYTSKESEKILELISDLVICRNGRSYNIILFENINQKLEKINSGKANKKYDYNYYRDLCIHNYESKYNCILNAYSKKKKYLKYFK